MGANFFSDNCGQCTILIWYGTFSADGLLKSSYPITVALPRVGGEGSRDGGVEGPFGALLCEFGWWKKIEGTGHTQKIENG